MPIYIRNISTPSLPFVSYIKIILPVTRPDGTPFFNFIIYDMAPLFILLLAIVAVTLSSPVAASPTEISETPALSIPITNVINGDLSAFQSNSLFAKYEQWLSQNPEAAIMKDMSLSGSMPPNLKGVDCYAESADCLFHSSFQMSDEDVQALAQGAVDETSTGLGKRRAKATEWKARRHIKTYENGRAGGHEHHVDWNLKVFECTKGILPNNDLLADASVLQCRSVDYRGTGFAEVNFSVNRRNENRAHAELVAKEYNSRPFFSVKFLFNFVCGLFSGNCCEKDHQILWAKGTEDWQQHWDHEPEYHCIGGSKATGHC